MLTVPRWSVLRSNQYLTHVLELCPKAFSWRHMGFSNPTVSPYFPDGVHSNPQGQYSLYRSYQGAILKALHLLWFSHLGGFLFLVLFYKALVLDFINLDFQPLLLWFIFILLGPVLHMFHFTWSPCCSCLFSFWLRALIALVLFYLGPLLLRFYFIWGLVAPVYFELEPLLLWLYFI